MLKYPCHRPCRASCPAGQYLSGAACVLGNEIRDRSCAPCQSRCPAGSYTLGRCDGSTTYDTTRCAPCGSCQPGPSLMLVYVVYHILIV